MSLKIAQRAQNGRTPKSLTLEIHHDGWFTLTPSRLNVLPFLIPNLGLDYGLHSLNIDADVLEMEKNEITRNESTGNESTGKQMVVHVDNSFTVDDVLELEMLYETEGVGPIGKFKELEHDDVFDDDEHIVEEVHVNMNNFIFTADPKHDSSICGVDVQDDDLDVIDYDLFDHVIKSLATNPDIPVRAVQDQIQKQFKVEVSKMKAFKAKRITLDIMTGPWPGQILVAVGVDTNNEIYLVAYARVEAESKASWSWFLNSLGQDLGIEANFNYTFISDRQKGLVQAIESMFPRAEHMYCVRHIHENVKSQFKGGVYKEMLCNAAKATSEGEFKKKMVVESRIVIIPPLYKPLIGRPPKKRKKSNDEITNQSASSGKLSKKGKSVSCGKYGNVGHNRKGCRGQGGGFNRAGARKVSGQAAGATNISGQAAGVRKVSSQAVGATNVSGQAVGATNVSGQCWCKEGL
nr:transposase, mutator type [Tanacetum cinerariifolium]